MRIIKRQRTIETKEAVKNFEAKTDIKIIEATKLRGKLKQYVRFLIHYPHWVGADNIRGIKVSFSILNPLNRNQTYLDIKWADLGMKV